MNETEYTAIAHSCEQLMMRAVYLFDNKKWQAYAELFTPDGVLTQGSQPDKKLQGRSEIIKVLSKRPSSRLTRHICTNVIIDVLDYNNAKGKCYVVLYASDLSEPESAMGRPTNSPCRIGEYFDTYVRTDDGWRIVERSGTLLFYTVG